MSRVPITGYSIGIMTPLNRLITTLVIIFTSILAGWLVRRGAEKGIRALTYLNLNKLRTRLQTSSIFALLPLSAMLSLWGLPNPEAALLGLPLLGLVAYIVGGVLALAASHMLKLDRPETGSMFCCGTFTNLGAVGGLVCLVMLGENTIALVALYRLLEELYYFGVAFPIAQWYGRKGEEGRSSFRIHPALPLIVCALLAGMLLNYAGVPRPVIFGGIASLAMLFGTIFFLFAIGLTLKFTAIGLYLRPSAAICAIKFIGVPLAIVPLAQLLGYGSYEMGLPLKVAAILSAMPVAMTALVPPAIFNLDIHLANSCWIISTLCLPLVLPCLMFLLPLIGV